jgi:hypothetical protein
VRWYDEKRPVSHHHHERVWLVGFFAADESVQNSEQLCEENQNLWASLLLISTLQHSEAFHGWHPKQAIRSSGKRALDSFCSEREAATIGIEGSAAPLSVVYFATKRRREGRQRQWLVGDIVTTG